MKLACCRWCLKIIKMQDTFDPKGTIDSICSDACRVNETAFMTWFSDEAIGLRNYEQFGVNPNHRGKKGGNTLSDIP
jgi:hypothetical protein